MTQPEKFTLSEESTRVPRTAYRDRPRPDERGIGLRSSGQFLDIYIYPTLIELCGLPRRDDLDGVSLVPLLKEPQGQWS